VVAGTGSDPAGRVAYVKTVQPGTVDQGAASYPGSAGDVHVHAAPGYSNVNYEPSAAAGGVVTHMVVEADVNTDHVSSVCLSVITLIFHFNFVINSTHKDNEAATQCVLDVDIPYIMELA